MLQLSRKQYKDLCTECASKMMTGSGADMSFPSTIPDFEGTDISFFVMDPALDGSGFMDTLKGTYNKVRDYIGSSKLAQEVVKKGIKEGKKIARGVADQAVKAGVEYLPEAFRGPAEGLAAEALNKLESKAERAAESAIIGKPSAAQAPTAPRTTTAPTASTARAERDASGPSRKRMRGSGFDSGLMAPHPLASTGVATAPAWSNALAPGGSVVTQTPRIAGAY
jgi:hypothetical protein